MQFLTVAALFTTAAFASPIAQAPNTPPAGTPVYTPASTPIYYPLNTPVNTPVATPGSGSGPGFVGGGYNSLPVCGPHAYDPRAFHCYDSSVGYGGQTYTNILCPLQNGEPLAACGPSCYDPEIFTCGADGILSVAGQYATPAAATPMTPAGVFPPAGATPTGGL